MQDAFRKVSPYILEHAGKSGHTNKSDGSPVTEADKAVEKVILAAMAERFPDVPVFGEEAGYDETNLPEVCWLIDPIDGTGSFIENIPAFTNMAVLIQKSEAVASVIYNVALDEMYVAQKGKGATRNGVRLDLHNTPLPPVAYCKGRFIEPLNTLLEPANVQCQLGPNGGGNGLSLVAGGQIAARFNLLGGGYVHDYAPGVLLVQEAGGDIVLLQDAKYSLKTRSFVACHPQLAPLIRQHASEIRELELRLQDK